VLSFKFREEGVIYYAPTKRRPEAGSFGHTTEEESLRDGILFAGRGMPMLFRRGRGIPSPYKRHTRDAYATLRKMVRYIAPYEITRTEMDRKGLSGRDGRKRVKSEKWRRKNAQRSKFCSVEKVKRFADKGCQTPAGKARRE
jgi:hypothetical protein